MNENSILKTFNYEGNAITFQTGNGVMVNATEMAKTFGKRVPEWTRLQSTKDFLDNLWTIRSGQDPEVQKMHYDVEQYDDEGLNHILKCFDSDLHLIVTSFGGQKQGTWMHEDVALEFARWLSPKFAIWCNDRIKELITTGVATVADDDAAILHAMQVLQKRVEDREIELKEAKSNLRFAEGQIEEQQKQIKELAPKADYTDKVLQSKTTLTFSQVALDLGLRSIHVLTRFLSSRGVIYRQSGQWLVASKFREGGYFETRTHLINHDDKRVETKIYTVVTEKGREWLHTIIEANRAKGFAIN